MPSSVTEWDHAGLYAILGKPNYTLVRLAKALLAGLPVFTYCDFNIRTSISGICDESNLT